MKLLQLYPQLLQEELLLSDGFRSISCGCDRCCSQWRCFARSWTMQMLIKTTVCGWIRILPFPKSISHFVRKSSASAITCAVKLTIVLRSAAIRNLHDIAVACGLGADVISPYLLFATASDKEGTAAAARKVSCRTDQRSGESDLHDRYA